MAQALVIPDSWQHVPTMAAVECKSCGFRVAYSALERLQGAAVRLESVHGCAANYVEVGGQAGSIRVVTGEAYAAALTDEQLRAEILRRWPVTSDDGRGTGVAFATDDQLTAELKRRAPKNREHYAGVCEAIEVAKWIPKVTDTDLRAETQRRWPVLTPSLPEATDVELLDEVRKRKLWQTHASGLPVVTDDQLRAECERRFGQAIGEHLGSCVTTHRALVAERDEWKRRAEAEREKWQGALLEQQQRAEAAELSCTQLRHITEQRDGKLRYRSPVGVVTVEPESYGGIYNCPAGLDEFLVREKARGVQFFGETRVLLTPDSFLKFSSCLDDMSIGLASASDEQVHAEFIKRGLVDRIVAEAQRSHVERLEHQLDQAKRAGESWGKAIGEIDNVLKPHLAAANLGAVHRAEWIGKQLAELALLRKVPPDAEREGWKTTAAPKDFILKEPPPCAHGRLAGLYCAECLAAAKEWVKRSHRDEYGPGIARMTSSRLRPVQVLDEASLADLLADDEESERSE